ncbi:helix-turn-helix domain-containing protein [uncultured Pelagimonas sp.]|uniref:winged helix-turn-helix domain-containing protein n=1 Tax=uncultured Pelagimonas sp. TaxID=1618102 RepID=UPI003457F43E
MDHPGIILSRAQLTERVLEREEKPFDRAIDNQISRLRKKIEPDPATPQLLITERGGGYRLVVKVSDI